MKAYYSLAFLEFEKHVIARLRPPHDGEDNQMEGAEEESPEEYCVMNYDEDYRVALCNEGEEVLLPEYVEYLE